MRKFGTVAVKVWQEQRNAFDEKTILGCFKVTNRTKRRLASVKPTSNMCASFLCRNENISSATNNTKLNFSALHFSLAHRVLNLCMCNTQIYRQDWFHPTISFSLLQRVYLFNDRKDLISQNKRFIL